MTRAPTISSSARATKGATARRSTSRQDRRLISLVNPNFIGITNLANVATRSAFIAIIAVGATFVISAGDLDLSVGS
ncbi:hypothetical protein ACCS64_40000, partial [Rhizobium ruizarguesonis]